MEEQVENRNKRKIDIDWAHVFPDRNDDLPAELIVKKDESSKASSDDSASGDESDLKMPDSELKKNLSRMKSSYDKYCSSLPDKGEKLLQRIKRLEREYERRKLRRPETVCLDVDGCEKPTQSLVSGASNAFRQGSASSQFQSRRSFASAFTEKMAETKNCRAFDQELLIMAPCERWKIKSNEESSHVKGRKNRSSSRQWPFKCPISLSSKEDKSTFSSVAEENISSGLPKKKDEFQVLASNKSRQKKDQTLVLIDEDEYPPEKTPEKTQHVEMTEQEDKLDECMKDAKIYYPSRDDPESVEICYMDINHLAPETYLTSPIMNFYMRMYDAWITEKGMLGLVSQVATGGTKTCVMTIMPENIKILKMVQN